MANNGMFDYFTDLARRLRPATPYTGTDAGGGMDPLAQRQRFVAPVAPMAPAPAVDPTVDPATVAVRPRLVDVPPPPIATAPVDPAVQRLRLAQQQTAGYLDTTGKPVYGADGKQISGKVMNNDHGVLGRIGDVLRQAVISAGDAYNNGSGDPGQRLMAAIGGGIAGGVGGGFRPQIDEERQRLYNINRSQQNEQVLQNQIGANQEQQMRAAQIGVQQAEPELKMAGIIADATKNQNDAVAAQRTALLKQLDMQIQSGGYDPSTHKQLQADLARVGIHADTALSPNDKFYSSPLQDGGLAIVNTRTGDATLAFKGEKFNKATTVGEGDIKDEMFPSIMSPAAIRQQALASMDPTTQKSLKISDEADRYLRQLQTQNPDGGWIQKYVRPDGTIDEPTAAQDLSIGLLQMPTGTRLYENEAAAKDAQTKIAQKELALTNSQKGNVAELGKFRLALKGKPVGVANQAVDLFNRTLQEPNTKKRAEALKELYKQLGQ